MPAKVKVKVLAGRNLPVMDKGSDTTDAYVELKLGNVTHKTDVCRKSLNPQWSCTEWYRFEVDDADLQDEPLQLRLMDHDTYSANDAIGKVYISLNPLLLPLTPRSSLESFHSGKGSVMSGWIPVFDTMHGIRGEVNVIVKVELFNDFNKFRQSSCGVHFFHSPTIPQGYQVQAIHGFVEELVVNDDPEYQWIDKIRTPRASNEARQVAFLKLSGQVQRKIGLKAIELGANSVIGFRRCLDLEGEVGVVARGAGTAVTLLRLQEQQPVVSPNTVLSNHITNSPDTLQHQLKKYIEFINLEKLEINKAKTSEPNHNQMSTILDLLSRPVIPSASTKSLNISNATQQSTYVGKRVNSLNTEQSRISSHSLPSETKEETSLRNLLFQEDMRQPVVKRSVKKSINAFKKSSQNLLSKKFSGMRGKRFDSSDDDGADKVSINSYSSEKSIRFSFTDLKSEIKRKTQFRQPILIKSSSGGDGSGMAALLVRSVMHAHSSLDCIKESLESNSPISTLRRSSKSQAGIETVKNASSESENDERTTHANVENPVKFQFFSMDNISLNSNHSDEKSNDFLSTKKRNIESCPTTPLDESKPASYLPLPSTSNYIGSSVSSINCSSDEYSSSEGDDNSDDISDNTKTTDNCNLDTVSGVVRSVMEHQVDSNVISHMEEKLDNISPKFSPKTFMFDENPDVSITVTNSSINANESNSNDCSNQPIDAAKTHNDVVSSDSDLNNIKDCPLSKMMENIQISSHIISNVSSATDKNITREEEKYAPEKLPEIDPNMDLPSVMGGGGMGSHSLVDTALKTMLLDKVNVIGCYSPTSTASPVTSPESSNKNKFKFHFPSKFFKKNSNEDSSSKNSLLHKASRLSLSSLRPKKKIFRTFSSGDKEQHPSLITTAIQTILMEKVNIMGEIITHGPIVGDEKHLSHPLSVSQHDLHTNFPKTRGPESIHSGDSDHEYHHDQKMSEDLLSLTARETVLGSPFISYNELRYASDPNLNILHSPNSDTFSLMSLKSADHIHHHEHINIMENLRKPYCFNYDNSRTVRNNTNDCKETDTAIMSIKCQLPTKHRSMDDINELNGNDSIFTMEKAQTTTKSEISISKIKDDYGHEIQESKIFTAQGSDSNLESKYNISNNSATFEHNLEKSNFSEGYPKLKSKSDLQLDFCNMQQKTMNYRGYASKIADGGSLTTGVCGPAVLRPSMNQDNLDLLEYPFLTIVKFPPGFILHIGGAVAARSVKLLERVPNPEEPAPRDAWWSELRTEVRSHMRALRCNAVLAYQETTTICDDICVLSATGTAAVIDLRLSTALPHNSLYSGDQNNAAIKAHEQEGGNRGELTQTTSLDRTDFDKTEHVNIVNNPKNISENHGPRKRAGERCGPCHLPYKNGSVPFRVSVTKCAVCKKGRVPSVMLCSIEPIDGLSIVGRGCLVQAVASRARVPARGEPAARDISDQLPFLEYELHRLLLAKLRVRGMNAIFGLKTTIAVGATVVAAVGVGTGVLLTALGPCAGGPRLRAAPGDPHIVRALQRDLDNVLHTNRNVYHLHMDADSGGKGQQISDTEESDEELPDIELGAGNKDTCVLEIDDAEDLEVIRMLNEARPPAGLHVVNTQSVPGLPACESLGSVANLQMFTQLWRARLTSPPTSLHPHFHRLLQSVYFKLRRMVPCAVCDLKFRLDLPEADEIQLVVTGMALGICEPTNLVADNKTQTVPEPKKSDREIIEGCSIKKSESNEMIFTLDEESSVDINCANKMSNMTISGKEQNLKQESPGHTNSIPLFQSSEWRPTVVMTPLALIPGGRIVEYLGNLDFIFVRESTSVREQGGLSGFLHTFITEVLAVVRAHVTALGGNAIVAFYMTELILSDNPHKNQAQCLVSVGGDVVLVSYFGND